MPGIKLAFRLGLLTGVITATLWFFTEFGAYIGTTVLFVFLLFAYSGKGAGKRFVQSYPELKDKLTIAQYDYLVAHRQFFAHPATTHMVAQFSLSIPAIYFLLAVSLGFTGRWLEMVVVIALAFGCLQISGKWTHPFFAAARANEALNSGNLSLLLMEHKWLARELEEKRMYDVIIEVTNQVRNRTHPIVNPTSLSGFKQAKNLWHVLLGKPAGVSTSQR